MKRETPSVIALALTWDGARVPRRSLPPKARAFLGVNAAPPAVKVAQLFRDGQVTEIRICWVPKLTGGNALSEPFTTPSGRRIGFKAVKTTRIGDILAVVYRKKKR